MAVKRRLLNISIMPMGHQPRSFNASGSEVLSHFRAIRIRTKTVLATQAIVTALTRLRMTDGASRLRDGEGRVVLEI
jgi:hypothetical protein